MRLHLHHLHGPLRAAALATFLVVAAGTPGCASEDGEGGSGGAAPAGELKRSFEATDEIEVSPLDAPPTESGDVRWDPGVIRVSEADAAALIETKEEEEAIVMRWRKEPATRLGLEAGKIVLVPNVGLYEIDSAEEATGADGSPALDVHAHPAELGQAAEVAELDFDRTVGLGDAVPAPAGGLGTQSLLRPNATFTVKLASGVEIALDVKRNGNDLTLEGSLEASAGVTSSTAKIVVTLSAFRARGHVRVKDRKTDAFNLSLGHLNLRGSVEISGENKLKFDTADLKKMPLEIKIPVPVYGIPFFIKIGGSIAVGLSLETGSRLAVRGEFGVTGASEVRKEGSEVVTRRNLKEDLGMTKQLVQDARFNVALEFPRVGIGIGNDLASAELTLSHLNEFGRGLAYIRSSPDQPITEANSCFKLQATTAQVLKGKVSFLNLSISKKKNLWSSERVIARRGAKCDFFESR